MTCTDGVGASVLTWIDVGAGYWTAGHVVREVAGMRYDVRCDEGLMCAVRQQHVLSPSSGGAGAVLREAAAMGATDLVEALPTILVGMLPTLGRDR